MKVLAKMDEENKNDDFQLRCSPRMGRFRAVGSQLSLDPTLGNLVAELEVHLLVKTIDSLRINRPSITPEQDMDATITVAHARLADVPDLQL